MSGADDDCAALAKKPAHNCSAPLVLDVKGGTVMNAIDITTLADRFATTKRKERITPEALAARIEQTSQTEKTTRLPWLKFALFGEQSVMRAFVAIHADSLRFNHASRDWLVWDEHYWRPDQRQLAFCWAALDLWKRTWRSGGDHRPRRSHAGQGRRVWT
jgi:hypothetical protein